MRRRRDAHDTDDAPQRSAYDRALGWLARREQSRRELRARLDRSGYDEDETEAALDRLGRAQYQSDERFAEMLVRTRVAQGYGPRRIRAELRTHAIPEPTIRALLAQAEVDWAALAQQLLRRRYGRPAGDRAERDRRAQFLLRRGFDAATVRTVTHVDVDDAGAAED
ncbi:regulatory protein RecX [Mizugakiibacter sediminis]|uniref:Regulatory protein RecX n=1 Tax=Mizugakiibacter sediminis TaxID=1475481 RepID=A0A0K8QN76_9GAMM|nr:regulatory protein RecX [Mizugakiibacter sediminis]GAP65887.1 regulatory protein RecX [Mizugakiibacter sediminis]